MQMDEKWWEVYLRNPHKPEGDRIDLSGRNYNNFLSAVRKGHGFHPLYVEEQKDPALAIAQSLHIYQPICTSAIYIPVTAPNDPHWSISYMGRRCKIAFAHVHAGAEGIAIASEPWTFAEGEQHRQALGMNWTEHAKQVPLDTRLHLRVWKWWFCRHLHQSHKLLGRCYHEYTCNNCGYSYTVDSSD